MGFKNGIVILILFFSISFLQANSAREIDESMVVMSGEADYNGRDISLVGNVSIEHGLGKIHAHRLTISPSVDKERKMKFSFLTIENDVIIELKEGGKLCCQNALIDYLNLQATFTGNDEHLDVEFSRQEKNENARKVDLLILKCKRAHANLSREYSEQDKVYRTSLSKIIAEEDVRAYYNQDYLISSDYATYWHLPNDKQEGGVLYLDMKDPWQNVCSIMNKNGDTIKAQAIILDSNRHLLTCNKPTGVIWLGQVGAIRKQIRFLSDTLLWDDSKQRLILKDNIKIHIDCFGELSTNKEVRVDQYFIDNQKEIRSIISLENTELSYVDAEKNAHKLICQGPLTLDHEHRQAFFESPYNEFGQVSEGMQVFLEDILGDMYADHVKFDYGVLNKSLIPLKITMEGNVKIHNRFDGHVQESGSILQYTLADFVEYFPEKREMVLTGRNGGRVLFYDKVNNIRMSAPSLKVRRDANSPNGLVQGIGDVRFTLIEHEFDQLREHFQLKDFK